MSVLACARRDCGNCMCDRLIIHRSKYICDGCWGELLIVKENWPTVMTAMEVRAAIELFMDTSPGSTVELDEDGIDEEFKRLTE